MSQYLTSFCERDQRKERKTLHIFSSNVDSFLHLQYRETDAEMCFHKARMTFSVWDRIINAHLCKGTE